MNAFQVLWGLQAEASGIFHTGTNHKSNLSKINKATAINHNNRCAYIFAPQV